VCAEHNAAMSGEQSVTISDVYLRSPRQLPVLMPPPCSSSIVRTQCCFSLLNGGSDVSVRLLVEGTENADVLARVQFIHEKQSRVSETI